MQNLFCSPHDEGRTSSSCNAVLQYVCNGNDRCTSSFLSYYVPVSSFLHHVSVTSLAHFTSKPVGIEERSIQSERQSAPNLDKHVSKPLNLYVNCRAREIRSEEGGGRR